MCQKKSNRTPPVTAFFICQTFNFRDMTVKELIDQFCEFRGKCTTDDVVALNFAYEVLAPRWISVEDRLPDEDSSVIVVCHYENVTHLFVCGYKNGDFFNCASRHEPTHWMPLPEKPKGGEE